VCGILGIDEQNLSYPIWRIGGIDVYFLGTEDRLFHSTDSAQKIKPHCILSS
jgi:hypothetical protein